MKKTILLTTMLLAIVCGFAQVSTKTETTEKEDGNKQIKVTVKSDGKTTTIDTVITLNDGQATNHLGKKFKTKKGTHLTVKIDSLDGDSFFSEEKIDPMDKSHRNIMIRKIRKDLKDGMAPMEFDFPDMDIMKEFSFNAPEGPMHFNFHQLPGMSGRLHKVEDEEYAQLRKKGVLTDKEDLAEKLDVRFVSTSPCGEDCQIVNFVSKEKGKINITLLEKDGKVVDKTEAGIVSPKEVDGRNVFSCVINLGKDKKFTLIKLSKDGKLALFSKGF